MDVAENPDYVVVFQDEVHFQAQTTITRKWALKGSEPKVMSKPGKNNVSYSGFIIPETGELIVTEPTWFNYETVIQSLRDFIKKRPLDGKRYCMVLDNAPWHKKAIRLIWTEQQPEYSDIREAVDYICLPPYSPDLNPIEQIWRIARREKTHNRYFPSVQALKNTMDKYFEGFATPNEQLKKLCSFKCFMPNTSAA